METNKDGYAMVESEVRKQMSCVYKLMDKIKRELKEDLK